MPSKAQDDDLVMNLVELALGRPAAERQAYVRSACGEDTELLTQVWRYVQWEERMNGFLLEPLCPPLENEHPFEPGELLGDRFRIVREVAQGGMGIVYEAQDEKLDRRIALKCAKTGFRKRLPPEVRHATAISHPNVCKIFEIHTALTSQGEMDFLTMEFLDGETLSERLQRAPLARAEALRIGIQICAGIAEAHRNHVVHGDLKSNNIILTTGPDGRIRAVITDFGLARKPESGGLNAPSGARAGTPDYMAPELWKGAAVSQSSDIYALGVILYELAAGRRPYPSEMPWEQRLTAKPAAIDPKWDRILSRCLKADPALRFRDGDEVARALDPPSRRRWFAVAAAAAVLAIAASAFTYERAKDPRESWRLAVMPLQSGPELVAAADKLSRETDEELRHLSGGHVARLKVIPPGQIAGKHAGTVDAVRALFAATHALQVTLEPHGGKVWLVASLTDLRGGAHKDWKIDYAAGQLHYAPVALAGFVTGTLHLPALALSATLNAAAKQQYLAGLEQVRRDSAVDSALASFEQAVGADPDSPLTYAGLAEAQWMKYFAIRDQVWLDRATESARQAELRNPDMPTVHGIEGVLLQNSGLYELAEAEFRRAIELDPRDSDWYRRLAQVLERNNRAEDALASYRRAIELEPNYYKNHQALGTFYYDQANYTAAVKEFEKTVALAGGEPSAHFALGNAYDVVGRYPDAERELRSSLQLGETPNSLVMLGVILMDETRPQDAIQYFSRALARFPEQYLWWIDLGIAYQLANQPAEAQRSFRSGLEPAEKEMALDPRNGTVRSRLAYLCAKLGDVKRAESEIAQALQSSPGDAATREMAVRTYDVLDRRGDAIAILASSPNDVLSNTLRSQDLAGLRDDVRFQQLLTTRQIK